MSHWIISLKVMKPPRWPRWCWWTFQELTSEKKAQAPSSLLPVPSSWAVNNPPQSFCSKHLSDRVCNMGLEPKTTLVEIGQKIHSMVWHTLYAWGAIASKPLFSFCFKGGSDFVFLWYLPPCCFGGSFARTAASEMLFFKRCLARYWWNQP